MTRRPVKARSKTKVRRTKRKIAAPPKADPLDDFILAGARALDLKISKPWMAAVRANLEVTLRLGAIVAAFPLADATEPAPVFEA